MPYYEAGDGTQSAIGARWAALDLAKLEIAYALDCEEHRCQKLSKESYMCHRNSH